MKVFLLVLKFGMLAVLYIFVFRVFQYFISDLRRTSTGVQEKAEGMSAVSGAELVVIESNDPGLRQGEVIKLNGNLHIGRGQNNQIKMTDSFVSHNHAEIIFKNEKYFLKDIDSVNGTYINGIRTSEAVPLTHGDTVRIAGVTFKFVRWEYEVE